ncbi:MAG: hypothetical protein FWG50_11645 [Kiritimatiellaeota bacterium]|nr:hypothetical protein [Kiritimatiellota bacterium]
MLEEKFDDPGTVYFIMRRFYLGDGRNIASCGNQEALGWARRAMREKPKEYGEAGRYLALKGDTRDIDILPPGQERRILEARVAGTNLVSHPSFEFLTFRNLPARFTFFPSVANTGPQALYAEAILRQCWKNLEVETRVLADGSSRPFKDLSKIPPELLTLVVWFDDGGNPVCNVDLAKYGLTMPDLDVPNRPKGKEKLGIRNEELGMGDEKSATRRLWPYALIIPAALAALFLTRRRRR